MRPDRDAADQVVRMIATGFTQTSIANSIGVDKSTISLDLQAIRQEAKEGIRDYIEETLPFVHKKTIAAFDEIIKQAWVTASQSLADQRVVLQALNVISDAVMNRQQVLGDSQYIEKAIRKVVEIRKSLRSLKEQGEKG